MALTQDKTTSQAMRTQVQVALAEDIGDGDRTAALIDAKLHLTAGVKTREAAVLCGAAWFDETFRQLDPRVVVTWNYSDGDALEAGAELCRLTGPARALLTGERTALNFLQLLCAVATATRDYVAAVAGTGARILDTRKTLPGLRLAQKYAVLCGGGHNHRKGLYDAILIKENHIHAAGSITQALARANLSTEASTPAGADSPAKIWTEVEVENLSQVEEALSVGAKLLLLDNFSQEQMRQAVALAQGRAQLEASGGVDLTTVRAIAETGVDFISVGALTKNIRAVDLSMRYLA